MKKSLLLLVAFLVVIFAAQAQDYDSIQIIRPEKTEKAEKADSKEEKREKADKDDTANEEKEKAEKKQKEKYPMKTLAGDKSAFGFFGSLDMKASMVEEQAALISGVRLGVIINHRLSLGIAGYGMTTATRWQQVAMPSDRVIHSGYGGLLMEYTLFPSKLVHVSLPLIAGVGGLAAGQGTGNDWDQFDSIETTAFFVVEPGAMAEINVTRFFRIGAGVSYRYVYGAYLPVTGISDRDLSKPAFNLSLKIGKF